MPINDSLRVLHVIAGVPPKGGGTTTAVFGYSVAALTAGIQVDIATTNSAIDGVLSVPLSRRVERDGYGIYYFRSPALRPLGFSPALRRWLTSHVHEYDLLHVHGIFAYSSVVAAFAARGCGVPFLIRPSGELGSVPRRRRAVRKHLFLAAFGRRLLCDAFSVHATSQQEAEDIRRHMATSHVSIIPPPLIGSQVPDGPIVRQCETRSTPRILIMARLDPIKGFDLILKAMSMLKDADVPCELIVAGSGPYEAVVRAEVSRLGLQARVKFAGHVEGDMKRNLLTCSDVFVLPSYHENFGMAAAEAAAAGIPVVVSDQVGVKDEIRRAKAGIIVPCSAYGLFVALRRVIMDSGLRHELSHNGRVHFAPRLNAVTIGADLAALYRRAANARCRA